MIKIFDLKNNPEDIKEVLTQRDADKLIEHTFLLDCERVPGAWIKKYGHRFKNLLNFKSHHFNQRIK